MNVYRTIGLVIGAVVVLAAVVYAFVNVLFQGKAEVGSEIELAPNRKPYLDDDELEGKKLDRVLFWGLITLVVVAIGLPLYWVAEPARQSNAATGFGNEFAKQGEELFAVSAEGGFDCANCHGPEGVGGVSAYNLTQPDGSIEVVSWKAPALNTVLLRYSREEVTYILTYGRPFSPMPAWGLEGGGPLNAQQIQNLVDYLETIQLTPEEAQAEAAEALEEAMGLEGPDGEPLYGSEGEALFNLGLTNGFAGGAYACGRCHTQHWSYSSSPDQLENPGCGALGPSLCGDSLELQFPENENPAEGESPLQELIDFVSEGSVDGEAYGEHGQGSGKMPGFGQRPAEPALYWINKGEAREPGPGMLTPEMIEAIVRYERSL